MPVLARPAGSAIGPLLAFGLVLAGCGEESSPSNVAPTATYTAQCAALGCTFTNGSTDADGTLEAYAWDFGDGSEPATTRDADHLYRAAGSYTVTLTVTDDDGQTTTASSPVHLTADPSGGLSAEFTVSCLYLACEFTDRSAAAPSASFTWTFGDQGEILTTRDASHTYADEGEFEVTLVIVDGARHAMATQRITVQAENPPPIADFIYSCTDLACEFTDRSSDEVGGLAEGAYRWDFGDGQISLDRNPSHTYAGRGEYRVELTVTDARGATASSAAEFTLPANEWPTAELEIGCYYSQCSFRTISTGGTIASWHWSFGDGATSTAERPIYSYPVPGTYLVQVTIADTKGATATLSREITVPFPSGPKAAFTVDCDGATCTFSNQSTGAAGASWTFGDGTGSEDWNPFHVYQVTEQTTFTVTLMVYDWDLGFSQATAEITVMP